MTEFFNRPEDTEKRRQLRNNMPPAEVILWSRIWKRQLLVTKFRRQFSVGPYCVDFYCPELKLAIEVDGDSHFTPEAKAYDLVRQRYIEGFGIRFLRFTNQDIHDNLDGVLEVIANAILEPPSIPPPRGGK